MSAITSAGEQRTTATGLFRYSLEYLASAMATENQARLLDASWEYPSEPGMFLALHSIELALKAILVQDGLEPKDVANRFRHNLPALRKAIVCPLLSPFESGDLELLNPLFLSTRYIETGPLELPTTQKLINCASYYVRAASARVLDADIVLSSKWGAFVQENEYFRQITTR